MAKGLTAEQAALMRGPCIEDAFPIEFKNGVRFSNPALGCARCNSILPSVFVRGRVTEPARHVRESETGGYCDHCDEFTFTRIRFYDDGRILQLGRRGWEEIQPRKRFLEQLRDLFAV